MSSASKDAVAVEAAVPKRTDAVKNRDRIIAAAYEVFAEMGVDAQMADIAKRTGLGVATVYRNFPSKEALVSALVLERLTRAARSAERVRLDGDPWEALERMLTWITRRQLENRVLSQFLGGRISGTPELYEQRDKIYRFVNKVVKRAQDSGQLRKDVGLSDIRMVLVSLAAIGSTDSPLTNLIVQRHVGIILDGLRAPGSTKLPGRPLSIAQSEDALGLSTKSDKATPAMRRGRSSWRT